MEKSFFAWMALHCIPKRDDHQSAYFRVLEQALEPVSVTETETKPSSTSATVNTELFSFNGAASTGTDGRINHGIFHNQCGCSMLVLMSSRPHSAFFVYLSRVSNASTVFHRSISSSFPNGTKTQQHPALSDTLTKSTTGGGLNVTGC